MKNKKKLLIVLLAGVAIISVIGFMFYQSNQGLAVATVQLEKINYEEYHYEEGTIKSQGGLSVFSPVAGKIADLIGQEGAAVKKGTVILNIDKDDLGYQLDILYAQRNSLAAEESEIKLQEQSIGLAQSNTFLLEEELARKSTLFESGAISNKEFVDAKYAYEQALGQVNIEKLRLSTLKERSRLARETKQLQIEQIEEQIEEMKVTAPIDGVISDLSLNKGDYVSAHQILFKIFTPERYEVESYVLAKEAKKLSVGMMAYIEVEKQNKTESTKGQITYIAPNAVELTSALGLAEKKVKVLLAPEEVLDVIQGEKVDVKFISYKKEDAQVVSKDYVFPWQDGEAIWIIEDGKAKILPIRAEYNASSVLVLAEEIAENTQVIIPPYPDKIAERIKVIE